MKNLKYLAIAAALVVTPAGAQTVHKIDKAKAQVIVSRDAEGFKDCGIRFVFAENTSERMDIYDMQMSVITEGAATGLITGSRSRTSTADLINLKGAPQPTPGPSPERFWIAKSTDAKPLVPREIIPDSEGRGFLIAFAQIAATVRQIFNVAEGYAMQVMLQYPGQPERVMELTAPLARGDLETLNACLDDLTKRGSIPNSQRNKPASR